MEDRVAVHGDPVADWAAEGAAELAVELSLGAALDSKYTSWDQPQQLLVGENTILESFEAAEEAVFSDFGLVGSQYLHQAVQLANSGFVLQLGRRELPLLPCTPAHAAHELQPR